MRIVGGIHKGRSIVTPAGQGTRPTSDRAREAMFNVLAHAAWSPGLEGRRVIDLFAGSGALGFEAMSRGAVFCLFVETDDSARGAIRTNAEALQAFGNTRVHRRSGIDLGSKPAGVGAPFDLVFLDPPYHKGLGSVALEKLALGGWLTDDAVAVFECAADEKPETSGFEIFDDRTWGAARVLFLKRLTAT
jgi:16S rRNA (guanine966-N2)-methyltransferase